MKEREEEEEEEEEKKMEKRKRRDFALQLSYHTYPLQCVLYIYLYSVYDAYFDIYTCIYLHCIYRVS